jgi:hypothetical protein
MRKDDSGVAKRALIGIGLLSNISDYFMQFGSLILLVEVFWRQLPLAPRILTGEGQNKLGYPLDVLLDSCLPRAMAYISIAGRLQ